MPSGVIELPADDTAQAKQLAGVMLKSPEGQPKAAPLQLSRAAVGTVFEAARQLYGFFVTHEPAILDLLRREKSSDQDTIVQ